ncbi:butyrophilin subfamily 3 member A2-like [Fundulus heteroclitus]|uniref:butyrophilin subfamily 3 member A2-like n=1 Tax=Fundulus heteroclitus TaxID=8078 RepID=UPI00165B1029|nr:butyrophilin subfamily 3 member A2-like [Fundulus heteroclitus]
MKKLKEKENEENQEPKKVEKQNLAEKKSNLEEELKKRNEDQRSIDQQIEALMKMSEELKEQEKRLTDQREEAEKMAEEIDKKLKAVVGEVENQKFTKTERKAQGYLKLKEIMTESNDRLDKTKMVHMPGRLSLNSVFKEVLFGKVMFGFLLLVNTCKGQSLETNQPQLVTAMVGEDVVLPCHLGVAVNVDDLVLEWGRLDLNPRLVYVWFEGSEYTDDQNTAYRGRTSLFTDRLRDGDVSLRLTGVRHSDNARFRCYDPKGMKEYFINLLVGSVSSPTISLAGRDGSISGVMLDCSSAGWFPEPEMFWLDGEGSIMSAGAADKTRSPDGLYTVSSRVTVEKRHNNNITCRVQQKDINQTRETHFYVQDGSFVPQPDCSVSVSFTVILAFMVPLGAAAFCWKWRQTKTLMKKLKEKENGENQQLLKVEMQNLAEKKSNLEEEIKKRDEDQRSIDQQIEALMMMSVELKKQEKRLTDQREEAEKMAEENDRKLNKVVDEVENQKVNRTEKKAQGYLKLKEIITEGNDRLDKTKNSHQEMELMTQKLMSRISDEVTKLQERKQELEKHVEILLKQLKEMETQM